MTAMTQKDALALVRAGCMVECRHPERPDVGVQVFLCDGRTVICAVGAETVDASDPAFLTKIDRYTREAVARPDGWTVVCRGEAAITRAHYREQLKGGLVRDLP